MRNEDFEKPKLHVLSEEDLLALAYQIVESIAPKFKIDPKWVSEERAMELLTIKAKSTMQELRDDREIRFSQPRKKIILYDRDSIDEYLERHARKPRRASK